MRHGRVHRKRAVVCFAALALWGAAFGARAQEVPDGAPAAAEVRDEEAARAPAEALPDPTLEIDKTGAEAAPSTADEGGGVAAPGVSESGTGDGAAVETAPLLGPETPTAEDIGPLKLEVEVAPPQAVPPLRERGDRDEYFARIVEVHDFVRVADRDRAGYANYNKPHRLEGDYHIQTPKTGGAKLAFPDGVTVRMDPDAALSWLDEEITLREGFFDIEVPTLYYVRLGSEEENEDARGARRVTKVLRTLDQCAEFLQATRRTHFQILLRPGEEPKIAVIKGDLKKGRELLLPPRQEASFEGLSRDLRPPEPMIPFAGHRFYLPLDELAFVVDSPAGRAWIFEFSTDADFAAIFCRVQSPKNSMRIPPFGKGIYYWRVGRINPDGLRTLFSDPVDFEIE